MITLKGITKKFNNNYKVIDNLNVEFQKGHIVSMLAPSGGGKTTLLRIISGLTKATKGIVLVDDKQIVEPTPDIAFIFQESSAFPWLTVKENISFGLKLKANQNHSNSDTLNQKIFDICNELNLEKFLDFYPSQLSGGQKQRLVIARSLILEPKIVLCDEPFSALDEITRNDLRLLLLGLHKNYAPTIIFITHSIEEALFLGNRLILCSGPPLVIQEDIELNFTQERNLDLLDSQEFLNLKKTIKNKFLNINYSK
jgi:NitT/TauT family transport system ATP-binding protein